MNISHESRKTMRLAVIHENDCVGCAKCLAACPIDAIIGSPKFLHHVLGEECIGCGLCVPPCPMDCIEMIEVPLENSNQRKIRAAQAKTRYQAKVKRKYLEQALQLKFEASDPDRKTKIQHEIQGAFERVQEKRMQERIAMHDPSEN